MDQSRQMRKETGTDGPLRRNAGTPVFARSRSVPGRGVAEVRMSRRRVRRNGSPKVRMTTTARRRGARTVGYGANAATMVRTTSFLCVKSTRAGSHRESDCGPGRRRIRAERRRSRYRQATTMDPEYDSNRRRDLACLAPRPYGAALPPVRSRNQCEIDTGGREIGAREVEKSNIEPT